MIERGEIDSVQRLFKRTQGANFVDGTQWAPAGQCEGDSRFFISTSCRPGRGGRACRGCLPGAANQAEGACCVRAHGTVLTKGDSALAALQQAKKTKGRTCRPFVCSRCPNVVRAFFGMSCPCGFGLSCGAPGGRLHCGLGPARRRLRRLLGCGALCCGCR